MSGSLLLSDVVQDLAVETLDDINAYPNSEVSAVITLQPAGGDELVSYYRSLGFKFINSSHEAEYVAFGKKPSSWLTMPNMFIPAFKYEPIIHDPLEGSPPLN